MKIFFSADLAKVPPFVLLILQFNVWGVGLGTTNLGGVKVWGDSCGRQATFRMCRSLRFLLLIDDSHPPALGNLYQGCIFFTLWCVYMLLFWRLCGGITGADLVLGSCLWGGPYFLGLRWACFFLYCLRDSWVDFVSFSWILMWFSVESGVLMFLTLDCIAICRNCVLLK